MTSLYDGAVGADRWPWCDTCGEGTPREGRSWYCAACRRERRRANQTRTQRTRRTAMRADPDTSALVTEVRRAAADLDAYLQRAQAQAAEAGKPLTGPQR